MPSPCGGRCREAAEEGRPYARLYPEDVRALEAVTAVPDGDSGTLRYLKQDVLSQGAPLLLPEDVVSEIFLDPVRSGQRQ